MNSNNSLLGQKSPSVSPQRQSQVLSSSGKKNQGGDNTKYPICFQCKNRIKEKQCVILGQKKYHIDHFRCNQCNQKLANRLFYEYRNKIYCEDDYKQFVAPICNQCKNFIQGKYISAKNLSFHLECFVCQGCNFGIEEKQEFFFSPDKKFIYCKKCKKKCQEVCQKCKRGIRENEQIINGSYYHMECLQCSKCYQQNSSATFVLHNNQIVHDTCILICHHCNEKIDDEKDISHYFEYVLHSKCQQPYQNFIRQKTINAFKSQNSKKFMNPKNSNNSEQNLASNLSPPSYSVNLNQLESMFSNSLDQLNKQFQETKIKDTNIDLEMEMYNLASENLDIPIQNTQPTDLKLSEDETSPKQSTFKKKESLLQLPSSQDKQLCVQGASISAQKIKNKMKQKIDIINSESENDSD